MSIEDKIFSKYKLTLKALTPIFIGSGEVLNKTMYYYDQIKGIVKVVDEKKLTNFLCAKNAVEKFSQYMLEQGVKGNLATWLKFSNINPEQIDIWKYELKVGTIKKTSDPKKQLNEIKMFTKGPNGRPYIPASSIKGAIRTALLCYEILHHKEKYAQFYNPDIKAIKISDIEKFAFGDIGTNIFKAIRISDSEEIAPDNMQIEQRYDFSTKKDKPSQMPMFMECLNSYATVNFSVVVDEQLNKNAYFTKEKIEQALAEFMQVQVEAMEYFRKHIGEYGYMPNDNFDDNLKVNMCLGGASGFWSKVIVYALAPNKQVAIKSLAQMFDRSFRKHQHATLDKDVAPHAMKMINDNGEYIPIGLCNVKMERI